jgi:hypothetical protein
MTGVQNKWRGTRMVPLVLAPLLLAGYAIGAWWLDRWALGVAFDAYLAWQRVLANAAIGLVAMLLLAALTRRLLASIVVVASLQALVFVASSIKLGLLGVPVVLQDAYFITGLDVSSIGLLSQYVHVSWKSLFAAFAIVAGIAALFRFEPPWCRAFGVVRLAALASAIGLLVSLYAAAWPWTTRWYDSAHIRPSPLGLTPAVLHGGLTASMVHYHGVQRHRRFTVDAAALRGALQAVSGDQARVGASAGQRPDVVIVLSESFMDPRVLAGMDALPDPIPSVRAEIAAGNGGMMLAPTFGGGTVRTEFEVLTGMPIAAFPGVYYPYVDLNPAHLPGIVAALEQRGYASFALHGNSGEFWNRTNTYEAMGIDRFVTRRGYLRAGARQDGTWLSDRSMTDLLLDGLRQATKPTVAVAISIESHGPYDGDPVVQSPQERASIQVPDGLDAGAAREFRNYLYHLRHADREFARLLGGLRARQRPFVLLFFGDHLPAFGKGVYDSLGFVDGLQAKAQFVPWVLVTDSGQATRGAGAPAVHAWQLPAFALQATGQGDQGWFDFIGKVGERVDPPGRPGAHARLLKGLYAGANARVQGRFTDYAAAN